jgi:hypothetical protein
MNLTRPQPAKSFLILQKRHIQTTLYAFFLHNNVYICRLLLATMFHRLVSKRGVPGGATPLFPGKIEQ